MIESRPNDAFQPGDVLNNTYRIEALLGRGGTSDVYKARSEISGRLAALKVLKSEFSGNDDYLVLLTREEEIREIRHDAVVRYSENHRTSDGLVYLVMDYVEGPGLDKKLKQGPMPASDLLTICRRVTEGLDAAHRRNIVHRDLSPDNIILRGNDPAQAVIIDFGIAKDTNPGAETIVGNEFAGKYAYAAPEQLSGQTDARSDIYSLGALLLANFRGAPPDVGKNPMEVVRKKGEPLDTEDVPEPLKSLIDRMTAPVPDDRFQTAAEVLAFLSKPTDAAPDIDPDATLIVPPPRKPEARPDIGPEPTPSKPPAAPAPVAPPTDTVGRSRGGMVAALIGLVVVLGGVGGYFTGAFDRFLGPRYPVAEPYSLVIEKTADSAPSATGSVPSEQVEAALSGLMSSQSGTSRLTLASGDISDSWGADVLATLDQLAPLEEWRLLLDGNSAWITGTTTDAALHDRLSSAFASGLPGALDGTAEITLRQLFLATAEVAPVLDRMADCGPLALPGATPVGFGPDSDIVVTGRVADTVTRVELFDALREIAGPRNVVLDVEVLNPTLCLIETHLPSAPAGGIGVEYTVGDRNEPNPSGRFFVGENPVIDIVLPANVVDGYLTVSILDVSGNVFHLLPNLNRQDNSVASLRAGRSGDVPVRVAYDLQEAAQNGLLAFRVDDSALGKSKVIVLHSAKPLFDGLRPTSESAVGYARALQDHVESDRDSILSLDSRILVTAPP
ncbi:protein kinase [Sedimentitalea sp. JM2-8]|uniref:Protein kinase n=1 Tax=Sedimentitalea xiamensis TaxID=3050037 RepID=A0ABT7FI38_9RHOB|nr:serine/threonine protein kinase [Sedimentitalea xiamensis]MDK3074800.1 protein kinase [Sedimentitalea xiamensis]